MYKISWDYETGGVLLHSHVTSDTLGITPRPVFWEELNLLKLHELGWKYPHTEEPLMWACNKQYFYRGELMFEAKGANIYDSPIVLFQKGKEKATLQCVDVAKMLHRNKDFLFLLESEAIEFIRDTYLQYTSANRSTAQVASNQLDYNQLLENAEKRYKKKMAIVKEDCDSFDIVPLDTAKENGKRIFHSTKIDRFLASFSGGKDSQVVLDLCTRAIPSTDFEVIYSDTGYELPTSLALYEQVRQHYTSLYPDLKFSVARNHESVLNYWDQIGTPSDTHRWCCSVMKTAPLYRMLKIEGTNKQAKVLTFDGVRAEESTKRSRYSRIGKGVKHDTVINASPILEWSIVEIYLYIFKYKIPINLAYRNGMTRVGCVLCPFSSDWNDMISNMRYNERVRPFLSKIELFVSSLGVNDIDIYIKSGNWKRRAGGKGLCSKSSMVVVASKPHLIITITNPKKDCLTFLSAIGKYTRNTNSGELLYKGTLYKYSIEQRNDSIQISFENTYASPVLQGLIKRAINKAVYCINCEACEVECPTGALSILPDAKIDYTKCVHCGKCLTFHEDGCIVANSLKVTGIDKAKNKMKLTDYNRFGLNESWLETYLCTYETYFEDKIHGLNETQQIPSFKKWLVQAEILDDVKKHNITEFGKYIADLYINAPDLAWELLWINLSYNSPIAEWYIGNVDWNFVFTEKDIAELAHNDYGEMAINSVGKIIYALFRTFRESPLGNLGLLYKIENTRYKKMPYDELSREAIAYSLYKFASFLDVKSFRISDLYNQNSKHGLWREFGVSKEMLIKELNFLSNERNQILTAELNMGLDHISLREDLDAFSALKLIVG